MSLLTYLSNLTIYPDLATMTNSRGLDVYKLSRAEYNSRGLNMYVLACAMMTSKTYTRCTVESSTFFRRGVLAC